MYEPPEICGPKGRDIGAVSGGVDSTVAEKLTHEAIGDRYHGIVVVRNKINIV